jgi:hypothetical protein
VLYLWAQIKLKFMRVPWNRWPGWFSRYSDSLQVGRSGDRIPVRARFFVPVLTGSGAHLIFYTMGTESFTGVKRPVRDVDHPHPSNAEVKERVELYVYSPSGPSWLVLGWTSALTCYRETVRQFESKERLGKVCVPCHGVRHLQSCFRICNRNGRANTCNSANRRTD